MAEVGLGRNAYFYEGRFEFEVHHEFHGRVEFEAASRKQERERAKNENECGTNCHLLRLPLLTLRLPDRSTASEKAKSKEQRTTLEGTKTFHFRFKLLERQQSDSPPEVLVPMEVFHRHFKAKSFCWLQNFVHNTIRNSLLANFAKVQARDKTVAY